jgi:hypothetical protein
MFWQAVVSYASRSKLKTEKALTREGLVALIVHIIKYNKLAIHKGASAVVDPPDFKMIESAEELI